MVKRQKAIQEAMKRWTREGIKSIDQIGTRVRLCEELWGPALIGYIKWQYKAQRERREEWEIQIENQ